MKSAIRTGDLYIGRCEPSSCPQDILNYVENEFNIKPINCIKLDTKVPFSTAFKLTVNMDDREKLLNSDCWPIGIVCRKFFSSKN